MRMRVKNLYICPSTKLEDLESLELRVDVGISGVWGWKANYQFLHVNISKDVPFRLYMLGGSKLGFITVSGPGDGSAWRLGDGAGDAVREGDGYGDAVRVGKGSGHAKRFGSGNGSAWRLFSGDHRAVKRGDGRGCRVEDAMLEVGAWFVEDE